MMKPALGLVVLLMLFSHSSFCQLEKNFNYAAIQDTIPEEISEHLKQKLAEKKKQLAANKSKERNFILSLYERQNDRLTGYFNDDYFITHDELTDYLRSVLNNILKSNPSLARDVEIFAFREFSPNAYTFWDGTIGITLALLSRMENEDEIAFVICHELAHFYIGHVDKRILDLAKINYDPEIEKQIKTIRSSSYDKYAKLKKLYKDLTLSIYSHSREQEFQADSLGLILLANTQYSVGASVRLMEILDSIDTPQYKKNIDFKKRFNFKNYPFKDSWLDYSKSSVLHRTGDEEYGASDTARTHPDCKKRLVVLRNMIAVNRWKEIEIKESAATKSVIARSEFESVHSEFHFKHYAKSQFIAFQLLDRYPDNVYLHAMIIENMYGVYQSQLNHRAAKSVPQPDSRYPENYDRLLSFLQKLRLTEVAGLTYNYAVSKNESYFEDEEYVFAFWMASHLPMSELSPNLIKADYLQKFPSGKHVEIISKSK